MTRLPWSPDPLLLTRTERAETWLWEHPAANLLVAAVLFGALAVGLACLWWAL